jgi:hypothetical protein
MNAANTINVYTGVSSKPVAVATLDAAYEMIEAATERTLFRVSEVDANGNVVRYFEKVGGA